ncbi:MAG: glycosyltransferase family 2 protein [Clostridium sp.]|uniref:glycosyltransferase family 2 protein n=1 Tax=Clostridium sp. TaxID=1506 RepID=UPI0025C70AC9|nr:glycosyltransferase family 2 protein [Clostridium sp.]MCF0149549.1 glycosyltransferase family 2 protein [Clostridium sp.]
MPKISLIVAAYNIEDYIERCIESLLKQTFSDIEIIIVNDGSTDGTLNKIENAIKNDNRVKVINKENEGVVEARRTGFINATGEYVLFIDGDDWIDTKTCEKCYEKLIEDDYDILYYGYYMAYDNGKKIKVEIKEEILKDKQFLNELLLVNIRGCMWSKLIRRSYLIDNNIDFPKGIIYGEDLAMSVDISCYQPKVVTINEQFYYYYQRENSITNRKLTNQGYHIINALDYIKESMIKNGLFEEFIEEYNYLVYRNLFYSFITCNNEVNHIHKELYCNWINRKIKINDNKYIRAHIREVPNNERIRILLYGSNYELGRLFVRTRNYIKKY